MRNLILPIDSEDHLSSLHLCIPPSPISSNIHRAQFLWLNTSFIYSDSSFPCHHSLRIHPHILWRCPYSRIKIVHKLNLETKNIVYSFSKRFIYRSIWSIYRSIWDVLSQYWSSMHDIKSRLSNFPWPWRHFDIIHNKWQTWLKWWYCQEHRNIPSL